MEWKFSYQKEDGLFKIPKRWLHIHYYEAFNILFRFENSLRIFVYAILKNEFFDKWKECSFPASENNSQTINGLASKRISQAENFGYLGFDIIAPLMHLTSGELVDLITSNSYWPKFKIYFKGNKEIIKNKLLEIGTIRNSLAHFRPIKSEDIELIKQNSRHTLIGVEECLSNIYNQSIRVPTNTCEDWYTSISTIGTETITTIPYYSSDELWVNIKLSFKTLILEKQQLMTNFYRFVVAKINTPNILLNHKELAKYVTCVTENVGYPSLSEEIDIIINKDVNLVFRKDILSEYKNKISDDIKNAVQCINSECDLLSQDNLARGLIAESAEVTAWFYKPENEDGKWNYQYNSIYQEYKPNHPDEYWGLHQSASDIVGGCQRYPWMPENISQYESFMD